MSRKRNLSSIPVLSPEARRKRLLERLIACDKAKDDLITYTTLTSPVPTDPDNVHQSLYLPVRHHRVIAAALEQVSMGLIKRLIIACPPRHGKACAHDTPVLTPTGWRTHGDLRPGDEVFGADGHPTTVLAVSPDVDEVVPVELSNGAVVRCHLNHEWTVKDRRSRTWRTIETRAMLADGLWLKAPGQRGSRARFQLPHTPVVKFPEQELTIHPYALGAWLGDGSRGTTRVAHDHRDQEVIAGIEACGYPVSTRFVQQDTGVAYANFGGPRPNVASDFQKGLKEIGVLNRKHIPDSYKMASVAQRLELLAGLSDTDGHIDQGTGRVRIVTCDPVLAEDIHAVATTLGFRPYITRQAPHLSTSGVQGRRDVLTVAFQPTMSIPTRVPRKAIRRVVAQRRVTVRSIGPVEKAGARSIHVSAPDGLYLVGRELTVTHNTELASKRFIPFFSGNFPEKSIIFGSYNEKFAWDIGKAVRDHMRSSAHQQVFPDERARLKADSQATDRLETEGGGVLAFVGRGGTTTGRGAHVFILDDPIKDQKEARSPTIRNDLWEWFNRVVATRLMDKDAAIVIIQTRWSEDDLVGRLTDPSNDYYDPEEAKNWKIIDLPALALDNDPMGRRPGQALWPERFDEKFLEEQQRRDPIGFSALYQGRPTPAAGNMIDPKWLKTYKPHELPKNLRYYASSDHAVTEEQRHDKTCLMIVGVDEKDNIYILPDVWWRKANTMQTVDGMLEIIRRYRPIFWWAEKTHISKSIGPFLRKRMLEERLYCPIIEVTPVGDKQTRAQSIQGRIAMEKVFFPERAMWWPEARDQLTKFPGAAHDDFVDALAYIGLGLNTQVSAAPPVARDRPPKPRTFGELIADTNRRNREAAFQDANKGW